jgi:hypothetical protein
VEKLGNILKLKELLQLYKYLFVYDYGKKNNISKGESLVI